MWRETEFVFIKNIKFDKVVSCKSKNLGAVKNAVIKTFD